MTTKNQSNAKENTATLKTTNAVVKNAATKKTS